MRRFRYIVFLFPLFLSGCSLTDAVLDWLSYVLSFLYEGYASLTCMLKSYILEILLFFLQGLLSLITPIIELLPEYQFPIVDFSEIPFLGYAAYFLPISEISTLMIYFLQFMVGFWVVRVILRWLKILR